MNEYEVEVNGLTLTVQLSDEDAKRYPDAKKVKPASVEDKAVKPSRKS